MRLAVVGFESLEDFLSGLPFIKGLHDIYREAEIVIEGPAHYKKIKEFCTYISDVVPVVHGPEYAHVIDVKNRLSDSEHVNFESHDTFHKVHRADQLLATIPAYARRRQIVMKETLNGFEAVKKLGPQAYDIVLYPFQSEHNPEWNDKDFMVFLSYFFNMNEGRRICVVGFEHHREDLERKFKSDLFPKNLVHIEICSLDKMISLLNRSSLVLTSDTSLKFMITNDDVCLMEVKHQDEDFYRTCSYRENSYLVHFKRLMQNKMVYTYDEIVFDNHSHLLAYIVTSVLDEDEEKLRWFAEKYTGIVDLFKTKMDSELGLRLLPVFWGAVPTLRSLVDTALRLQIMKINKPHFAEEFYFYVHDESDFSQERILYDLDNIRKFLEHLTEFFKISNDFSRQMKIKNTAQSTLEEAIFTLTQNPEDVVTVLFFIRQVMNVSSVKLLENLPMTASYYS